MAQGLLLEMWNLLVQMAPYLLFGFTIAGVLKVLLPEEMLVKHLAGKSWTSVFKAAMVGVPLPLCSCGVIPVTAHLKRSGAGNGAILSFLTSTPTTGVDSIFATMSLLGWPFAIMRIIASFFIGIVAGLVTNIFGTGTTGDGHIDHSDGSCGDECKIVARHGFLSGVRSAFEYAYFELIDDVGKWLVIGVAAGGVISYFVPTHLVQTYLGSTWISYTVMLLVGIPMYVCATGSIPIAASLIMKGMSPGAGLVFLIAGPATNTATISFVAGKLGRRPVFIYLGSIIVGAVLFGALTDLVLPQLGINMGAMSADMQMLPSWVGISSAIILVILILKSYIFKIFVRMNVGDKIMRADITIKVPDMTCDHCKRTIETALKNISGVESVWIDLDTKAVGVNGKINKDKIIETVKSAGYNPTN